MSYSDGCIAPCSRPDLVGYDEAAYTRIRQDFLAFAEQLQVPAVPTFPISTLVGDNVVETSAPCRGTPAAASSSTSRRPRAPISSR